jgi:hypothetical protein
MCRFARISLVFPFLFALFSCADSIPALVDARLMPVFEFAAVPKDSEVLSSRPSMFVYLLANPTSEIALADSMRLTHRETGFVWNIANPLVMQTRNDVWVSGPRLAPYDNLEGFAEGAYLVAYIDTSGRISERTVQLAYIQGLKTATTQTVSSLMPADASTKIAIYDEEDNVIYYGVRDENIQTDDMLMQSYPDAFSYRECISPPDNAVMALLPMVSLVQTDDTPD